MAVVSVYPVATTTIDTPSKKEQAAAKPLNTPMMAWFFDKVLSDAGQAQDPRLNLIAADLKGLPPVTIINAELDPLKSDGDTLTEKMKAAGNDITHKRYAGVTTNSSAWRRWLPRPVRRRILRSLSCRRALRCPPRR